AERKPEEEGQRCDDDCQLPDKSEEERRALRDYIPCPQWRVVVNRLQELGVGVGMVRHGNWLGESNEFHKRFFIWGCLLQIRAERGTIFSRSFKQPPRFG